MKWELLSSVFVVDDPWLRVSRDRCRRADGSVVEPYYRIHGRDWVNVCPLFTDGTIVLLREYRHGYGRVLHGLPGGLIDATDSGEAAAARRELREETGVASVIELVKTASMVVNPSTHTNLGHSFFALCDVGQVPLLRTIEPDIDIATYDYFEVLAEVISGKMLLSGYDAASLLRSLFFVARWSKFASDPLRRRARDFLHGEQPSSHEPVSSIDPRTGTGLTQVDGVRS